jgi:hypothetical protein
VKHRLKMAERSAGSRAAWHKHEEETGACEFEFAHKKAVDKVAGGEGGVR